MFPLSGSVGCDVMLGGFFFFFFGSGGELGVTDPVPRGDKIKEGPVVVVKSVPGKLCG